MRDNDILDEAFNGSAVNKPTGNRRRKKAVRLLSKDAVRRHSFRVLSILAGLDAAGRERVLKHALKIHRA